MDVSTNQPKDAGHEAEAGGVDAAPGEPRPDRASEGSTGGTEGSLGAADGLLGGTDGALGGFGGADGAFGAAEGLSRDDLLALYRVMALGRALDERMWILNRAGRVAFVISGQGHEGAQAGITWALRPGFDWLAPYYRSITACLQFGMTPREIMLGSFSRADDPSSGGRQMPNHYGHIGRQILSVSSPVASQLLHAVGIALAAKVRGTAQVALTVTGEGSSNQGDVHEGLNFAAIHRLPFIYVVENNGYAISVPTGKELPVGDVASRAAAYGIPGVVVDGTDVLACYRAGREAVRRARAGEGPTLIEAKVERLTAHSSDDQQTRYRSAEEIEAQRARDPLPVFRGRLRAAGVLTDQVEAAIAAEVKAHVEDATTFAEGSADPDVASAARHVFAEAWPGERLPSWGLGTGRDGGVDPGDAGLRGAG